MKGLAILPAKAKSRSEAEPAIALPEGARPEKFVLTNSSFLLKSKFQK
jgi:hypothetical protein